MKGFIIALDTQDPAETWGILRHRGYFPDGDTYWFAWNDLDIRLPSRITAMGEQPPPEVFHEAWDLSRVFSPRAELRFERLGSARRLWLLAEGEDPPDLPLATTAREVFQAEPGRRILWGERLSLPDGDHRGLVAFPRPLDYGLPQDDLAQALGAEICLYYDETLHRLRAVRYCRLVLVPRDQWRRGWQVQGFNDPAKVLAGGGADAK